MTDQHHDPDIALEPDDILIPEKEDEAKKHRFEELSNLGKIRLPWRVRLLTAVGGVLLFIWGAASLVTWSVLALADKITMEKMTLFRIWRRWFWWSTKHSLGISAGLMMVPVNPPLGFGMVILYVGYQEGEDLQKSKFYQSVRDYLRKYETET